MKPFVIDIETAGRPDAADYLPEVTAPANYKDIAKIEAYLAEKRAAQLEGAALSAATAHVLVVGILRNGSGAQFLYDVDEKKLLRMTWLELETKEADEIFVTFNGSRFNWPMLARRSVALGRPSGVMGRPRSPVPLSERPSWRGDATKPSSTRAAWFWFACCCHAIRPLAFMNWQRLTNWQVCFTLPRPARFDCA